MTIVLASASPRRKEILSAMGVNFVVRTADADESCSLSQPGERVETIALRKEEAVKASLRAEGIHPEDPAQDTLIIACDTLVTIDGLFLGKPADEADARRMMHLLSGRTHRVVSGLALCYAGKTVTTHEETEVLFAPMSEEDIDRYLATGESFGKAGGYAIQGHAARFIRGIRGDYFNVVGLPVCRLFETVRQEFGLLL